MHSFIIFILILQIFLMLHNVSPASKGKSLHSLNETRNSPKRDNPNFIRDRKLSKDMVKPEFPSLWANRFRMPFDKAWMDYCDPYHCNDYYRKVCGLNRRNMKFKYFQSVCHLILNNQCSVFRGQMKFDVISLHFCRAYVMFLRTGCQVECEDEVDPICGMSGIDGHVVIFKNECAMNAYNCRNTSLPVYDSVYMGICEHQLVASFKTK